MNRRELIGTALACGGMQAAPVSQNTLLFTQASILTSCAGAPDATRPKAIVHRTSEPSPRISSRCSLRATHQSAHPRRYPPLWFLATRISPTHRNCLRATI